MNSAPPSSPRGTRCLRATGAGHDELGPPELASEDPAAESYRMHSAPPRLGAPAAAGYDSPQAVRPRDKLGGGGKRCCVVR